MTLFMETTKITPERTVGEIQAILCQYGARQVLTEYEKGTVSAVSFMYPVNGMDIPFRLPARWKPLFEHLLKERSRGTWQQSVKDELELKSKRVAWRQILRWVEAQLALVDTKMVSVQEVFMPYIQTKTGITLYESIEKKGFAELEYKP